MLEPGEIGAIVGGIVAGFGGGFVKGRNGRGSIARLEKTLGDKLDAIQLEIATLGRGMKENIRDGQEVMQDNVEAAIKLSESELKRHISEAIR